MKEINYDIKTIKRFIKYLKSDNEKFDIDYKHLIEPYSYSKEINEFIIFWNKSKLFRFDYVKYFKNINSIEIENINQKSTEFICYAITYFIRWERFSNGLIAHNLNKIMELLEELIIRLCEHRYNSV